MDDRVRIRRTRLRISTAEQPEPSARWHQHWAGRFQRFYAPCIEKALLDQLEQHVTDLHHGSDKSAVIHIPQLTLTLGALSSVQIADEELALMTRAIAQQIYDQLQPGINDLLRTHTHGDWLINGYLDYLQNGFWRSGVDIASISDCETRLMEGASDSADLLLRLRQTGIGDSQICRMALQHSDRFVDWLVSSLSTTRLRYLADVQRQASTATAQLIYRLFAIWSGVRQPPHSRLSALGEHEFDGILRSAPAPRKQMNQASSTSASEFAFESASLTQLLAVVAMWNKRCLGESQTSDHSRQHRQATRSPDEPDKTTMDDGDAALDSWLVCHCGVLLLHPFLPTLFQRLGWLTSDSPVSLSADHQLHALFALHYLATGKQQAEEGELLFAKYLLGMTFSEPVPRGLSLPSEIYGELDQLLSAAISHWPVLKNTSREGFRETFLQRTGCLMPLDEGHRLKVETRSVDLLLQQLPWAYELIALPWLDKPLFVEWH